MTRPFASPRIVHPEMVFLPASARRSVGEIHGLGGAGRPVSRNPSRGEDHGGYPRRGTSSSPDQHPKHRAPHAGHEGTPANFLDLARHRGAAVFRLLGRGEVVPKPHGKRKLVELRELSRLAVET